MTPPAPVRTESHRPAETRDLAAIALGGVVVLWAGLTIAAMSNNDIWIHIKTGDLILRGS